MKEKLPTWIEKRKMKKGIMKIVEWKLFHSIMDVTTSKWMNFFNKKSKSKACGMFGLVLNLSTRFKKLETPYHEPPLRLVKLWNPPSLLGLNEVWQAWTHANNGDGAPSHHPTFLLFLLFCCNSSFFFFFLFYYPPAPKMNTMGNVSLHHSYSEIVTIATHPPHEDNHREVRTLTLAWPPT